MWTSIRYILLCSLRDRLYAGLLAGIVTAALVASLLGSTALVETREMSLAYAGGACRLILMVGMIVFVSFQVRSNFESREIDVMLSRPVSRPQLVLAYFTGFALVALLLILPVAAALMLIGPLSLPGLVGWCGSLLLESWLVIALALFAALTLRSAVFSVLATLGFYVLSRMMAFFLMTATAVRADDMFTQLARPVMQAISVLVPRLDFFGKTGWLVYGFASPQEWQLYLAQAAIFIPLLVTASIIDFLRKQF